MWIGKKDKERKKDNQIESLENKFGRSIQGKLDKLVKVTQAVLR